MAANCFGTIRGYLLPICNYPRLRSGLEAGYKPCSENMKIHEQIARRTFLLTFVFLGQMAARASNLDTIGVTLLQTVTTNVNGAGIRVAQPEAGYEPGTNWEVNPGAGGRSARESFHLYFQQWLDQNFPNALGAESGHADAVAGNFYGIPGGVATNVAHVDNYDANYFVQVSIVSISTNYTASLPSPTSTIRW